MSDTADYQPSDTARLLGTIHPSALTAQPESAAVLPMKPVVIAELAPTVAEPPQAQPEGVNLPAPIHSGPEPKPQGGLGRPVPFVP